MTFLSQYLRYKGYIFTECSLPYEGGCFVENCKSQKNDLFSHREGHIIFEI